MPLFWILCYILLLHVGVVVSWHAFDNTEYHCWDLTASASNTLPISCDGINLRWISTPGEEIKAQDEFDVTYELILSDAFYTWAFTNNYFDEPGNFTTATEAKTWCLNTVCPDASQATEINCCVWHVNVHSCPLADTTSGPCGPWIQPSGATFTHSEVLVGPVTTGNWTSHVAGLYKTGLTSLIAHFRIAGMQIALETQVTVMPRAVCGDSKCEDLEGEDCESCPKDCGRCPLKNWQIALIGIFSFIIVAAIVSVLVYLQYQKRKLFWDESWIISYDSIKFDDGGKGAFGSMLLSTADLNNAPSEGTGSLALSAARRQIFAKTAMVKGRACAVKDIRKREFTLTKDVRQEVKAVRECDHVNLCKFVGASIVVPNVCILTEYCNKGSLGDVLLNDDIPLNWSFRFSFAADISRGMQYLHNHRICHGRLKSNNCVIDDRWTVKVTDYGLPLVRQNDEIIRDPDDVYGYDDEADDYYDDEDRVYQEKRAQVYKAPEFLSCKLYEPTMFGDIYAFAIILIEIATRNDPYGDEDAFHVPVGWKPPLPDLSPEMAEDNDDICPCPTQFIQLIEACWDIDPEVRPNFDSIKKTIHKINPNKLSPVDLMMAMMEKYSKHLESIVTERTQDLVAEKAKTDRLLYSMLPRSVADELRVGRPIKAEIHDACTIYFSDIVGFTNISGASTPMQVVGLLNKLYITFDEIIDKYGVYKVETIGDAYMVVSGIPEATIYHGREIADMAIDLVAACRVFTIPHMPTEPLKIRVGLHSGSACAGVVGLKMPRYCLFGDTVNTASRMESNGEAYKIHISNFTYIELVKFNKYILEKRGTIPVKGKGEMLTWWLTGYDPNYVPEAPPKIYQDSNKNSLTSICGSKVMSNDSKCSMNGTLKQLESELNLRNIQNTKALNQNGQIQTHTQSIDKSERVNNCDVTPVELPGQDRSTKSRKISNITTDSGYTDRSEEFPELTERDEVPGIMETQDDGNCDVQNRYIQSTETLSESQDGHESSLGETSTIPEHSEDAHIHTETHERPVSVRTVHGIFVRSRTSLSEDGDTCDA